ncbi:phage tail tape measure protein [Pseudomonas fluorescens]|uniref:Phage tail tape measure protein n=1 Tax=Pseudomonas fluorescens TaxID=294 RepID=A0A1T2YK08_PSEFL|nr:phage tail tape measure protein [Pseudomonas fluorescens]OPA92397.1 phage tail tape measure protein [Pseudomonas fluorescens]
MQDTYSLAYAMTRDGQGVFGNAGGPQGADSVNPGPLVPKSPEEAAPLSSMNLALTHAGLELSGLSLSLGLLRTSVDALEVTLSRLKSLEVEPSGTEQKSSTEVTSSASQELRLTREALTLGSTQSLDPVAAFQQSNASLTFDSKATSEKSITERRETSTKSQEQLTKTLETAPVLGEDTWLRAKTHVLNATNEWAGSSPAAAETLKTTEAVMSSVVVPLVSEFFSGLGDTIKDRVTGNLVDVTLGKLPGAAGKLFKEGGYDKEKGKGKDCCCPGESLSSPAPPSIILPAGYDLARDPSGKTQGKGAGKKRGLLGSFLSTASDKLGKLFLPNSRLGLEASARSLGAFSGATASGRNQGPAGGSGGRLGLIEALERGVVGVPGDVAAKPQLPFQPPSSALQAPPGANLPHASTSRLTSTMTRLESSAARRLGPLRYVDTAMDVIQGVRNGDAKAVGTGLSTAGGAWAGASAGAAIGTLIFPGVGTAVGGAIGGLLGSEAGSWLGDKLFGSTDRLPAPGAVSKEINSARSDSVQVSIAPSIQITGVNPADAQQVVNQVIQALQFQCMPMVTDTLGIRRNAALADPGGD